MMSTPWKDVLKQAHDLDEDISDEDQYRLKAHANNWFSCAIGEKLQIPETRMKGSMTNLWQAIGNTSPELHNRGNRFASDVDLAYYDLALQTMEQIHKLMTPDIIEKIRKRYIASQRQMRRLLLMVGDLPSHDMRVEGSGVSFD